MYRLFKDEKSNPFIIDYYPSVTENIKNVEETFMNKSTYRLRNVTSENMY